MGLIKAFSGAFRSELADQWKEYFVCDSMAQETLLQLGRKRINTCLLYTSPSPRDA